MVLFIYRKKQTRETLWSRSYAKDVNWHFRSLSFTRCACIIRISTDKATGMRVCGFLQLLFLTFFLITDFSFSRCLNSSIHERRPYQRYSHDAMTTKLIHLSEAYIKAVWIINSLFFLIFSHSANIISASQHQITIFNALTSNCWLYMVSYVANARCFAQFCYL